MDDSKLLNESNSTARQPCRVPIMIYISFNKRRRLANGGLVNLTGMLSLRPLREGVGKGLTLLSFWHGGGVMSIRPIQVEVTLYLGRNRRQEAKMLRCPRWTETTPDKTFQAKGP